MFDNILIISSLPFWVKKDLKIRNGQICLPFAYNIPFRKLAREDDLSWGLNFHSMNLSAQARVPWH